MKSTRTHTGTQPLKVGYNSPDGRDGASPELDWLKKRSKRGGYHRVEVTFLRGRYRFKRVSGSAED